MDLGDEPEPPFETGEEDEELDEQAGPVSPLVGISILVGMVGLIAILYLGSRSIINFKLRVEPPTYEEVRHRATERWRERYGEVGATTWRQQAHRNAIKLEELFERLDSAPGELERELAGLLREHLAELRGSEEDWSRVGEEAVSQQNEALQSWRDPADLAKARETTALFRERTLLLAEQERGTIQALREKLASRDLTDPISDEARVTTELFLMPWVAAYSELTDAYAERCRAILDTMDMLGAQPDAWRIEDDRFATDDEDLRLSYITRWQTWVEADLQVRFWREVVADMR